MSHKSRIPVADDTLEQGVRLVLEAGLSTGHADTWMQLLREVVDQAVELPRTRTQRHTGDMKMKLSQIPEDKAYYTQLASNVLAVLHRRFDGWCVYVDAVPGIRHADEWPDVLAHGTKQRPEIAEAIAQHAFFPAFEIDLPYAD